MRTRKSPEPATQADLDRADLAHCNLVHALGHEDAHRCEPAVLWALVSAMPKPESVLVFDVVGWDPCGFSTALLRRIKRATKPMRVDLVQLERHGRQVRLVIRWTNSSGRRGGLTLPSRVDVSARGEVSVDGKRLFAHESRRVVIHSQSRFIVQEAA